MDFIHLSQDEQNKISTNHPKCPNCFNFLFIKFSSSTIILHCESCSFWKKLEINENIYNEIFNKFPVNNEQLPNEIQCQKCLKYYCSFCYMRHNDVVTELSIDETKFNHSKRNINKTSFQEKLTYSNNNIRCEKCNRQYLSDIVGANFYPKKNIYYVKKDLIKGKEYLNNYYTNLKNEIINELQENIKQIEAAYTKNYNYHINIFRIIDKLIEIYNVDKSNTIYKSLLTFSNFSFPKINIIDFKSLNQKIVEIKSFYENEFIIKDTSVEKEKFFKNFQILKLYKPLNIYELDDILIYTDIFSIKIYGLFDFSLILTIPFPRVNIVSDIDNKTLLFGTKKSLHICHLTKNECKLEKIYKSSDDDYSISVLDNKQIEIIDYINGRRKLIILNSSPPYNIIKKSILESDIDSSTYELFDGSKLVEVEDKKDFRLEYYNKDGTKDVNKTIHIKYEEYFYNLTQIDDRKLFWLMDNKMIIYNIFSNQIETTISFKNEICRFLHQFPNENHFSIIFKDSFCVYDNQTFQLIFTFRHQLKYLTNFILLKNGTLLGLYDWNLRFIHQKTKKTNNYFFEDDSLQGLSFLDPEEYGLNIKSLVGNAQKMNESAQNDDSFSDNNFQNINLEDLNDEGINEDNGKCY